MIQAKKDIYEKEIFDLTNIDTERFKVREIAVNPFEDKVGILLFDKETHGYFLYENGEFINSESFDNAWNLRYSKKGESFLFISKLGTWHLLKNGVEVGDYEYIWNLQFNNVHSYCTAIKKDGLYGILVDDKEWSNFYPYVMDIKIAYMTNSTVAICQTMLTDEKDVISFKKGTFSLVKDGEVASLRFRNIRYPVIDRYGKNIAAVARTYKGEYKIIVNKDVWTDSFDLAWAPLFDPKGKHLYAPVKKGNKWYLFKDGTKYWDLNFLQLWNLKISENGKVVVGVCSPKFGKFTICVNNKCWSKKFPLIEDVIVSPSGSNIIAIAQKEYPSIDLREIIPPAKKVLILNNKKIEGTFDRIIFPQFSKANEHFSAVIQKKGFFYVMFNGKILDYKFSKIWKPEIWEEDKKIVIKGIKDNKIVKITKKF